MGLGEFVIIGYRPHHASHASARGSCRRFHLRSPLGYGGAGRRLCGAVDAWRNCKAWRRGWTRIMGFLGKNIPFWATWHFGSSGLWRFLPVELFRKVWILLAVGNCRNICWRSTVRTVLRLEHSCFPIWIIYIFWPNKTFSKFNLNPEIFYKKN